MKPIKTTIFTLVSLLLFTSSVYGSPPKFTQGTFNGASAQASNVHSSGSCSGMTQNKLLAIMLSIPVWEIMGGNKSLAPSPMVLSRWDGWSLSKNRPLYSFGTYSDNKRAHWNPGIGLWQLDTWDETLHLNHAERMNTYIGAEAVAERFNDAYCNGFTTGGQTYYGDAAVKKALYPNWFACKNNKCWNTFYNDIYQHSTDGINVNLVSGNDWDGGVVDHLCRWGSSGSTFQCYWINTNIAQGWMDTSDPFGNGARTPLAEGFLSFTRNNRKYAVWLNNSGVGGEVVDRVSVSKNARYDAYWYQPTSLQVRICNGGSCAWSTQGIVP